MADVGSRVAEAPVDDLFIKRWSPLAFADTPVTSAEVNSLFEAARWSPSSYNEQPWLFVYGNTEETLAKLRPLLVDGNRTWADKAPMLLFVFAKKRFEKNNKENSCAHFDCGSATMSLIFQAEKLGLKAHAMAGFHAEKAYMQLGVPEADYDAICAVAIGKQGDINSYPEALRERESNISGRKSTSTFSHLGSLST